MSAGDLNWDLLPDAVLEAFIERLHLVEMLLRLRPASAGAPVPASSHGIPPTIGSDEAAEA